MKTIVSPSLLSCDFLNIESELEYFKSIRDIWFHLDIMDGHFVPNLTFGHEIIKRISAKTQVPLDAHFMVFNPEFYVSSLKDVPLHNFTFHFEASKNPLELIKNAKAHFPSVGISIKPGTDVAVLSDSILEKVDLVLVMSVEPGFGGQKFMPNSLDKIQYLHSKRINSNMKFSIQVDGGLNKETSRLVREKGADNIVAGSYIFKQGPDHYESKISSLR